MLGADFYSSYCNYFQVIDWHERLKLEERMYCMCRERQDHHDSLIAAPKEYCAMCDNSIQIGCHICNATFFCRKACQEKLNELMHDDDCKQCIVFVKDKEVVIVGLSCVIIEGDVFGTED